MKATEIRDKIFEMDKQLYAISDVISKGIEDWDGIDPVYLNQKMQAPINTLKHIQGQLKYLKRK